VAQGTNRIVGSDPARILTEFGKALEAPATEPRIPDLWDGRASDRIAAVLAEAASGRLWKTPEPIA
jgi:UDP-N-acetylglucosamine 2-epimerase (non-hydrolysing)